MAHSDRVSSQREIFLSSLLVLIAGSLIFGFVFLLCAGLSFYLLAVIGGIAGLGFLNYLLWGHSFSRQVAGEREEEALRAELEEEPLDESFPPPRLF